MRARRRALALGALLLLVGPAAPAADGTEPPDGPGTNELDLRVERLDHAEQVDVAGDGASAMLFSADDTRAVEAAAQAHTARRQTSARTLFVGPTAVRAPPSAGPLFLDRGSRTPSADPTAIQEAGSAQAQGTTATWPLLRVAGPALLLVVGLVLSLIVREPRRS
ncbi:MAG TPA: hypothetical protein VGC37_19220 [Friedmanniella sp.]